MNTRTASLLVTLVIASLGLACDKAPAQATDKGSTPVVPDNASAGDKTTAAPPVAADAHAKVGEPAPDFTLTDADGKSFKLSEHAGKLVVLEWFNPGCPFVKYAHGEGPLKDMAANETKPGDLVWVAINSGAAGKQGAGADASREGAKAFGMTHPILIDESGAVGHAYGAEKTPHVFLVDAKGVLVYAGALDNAPIGEVDGGGAFTNYLANAIAEVRGGKAVATAETKSYGCSVKYGKS
jgi:cytochrome oxidase Cu insertion factor (SCO1/SenC/PrrC family)